MPLGDGIYIITNVKQRNLVFLENPDDCTPLQGHYRKNQPGEQWQVIDRGNGHHSIRNVDYKRYANCGSLAELGAFVEGHSREQLWHIQERSKGNYTIAATDTGNFWMLPYNEPGTPVGLLDKPTDQRCWWSFRSPTTEAPVNEGVADEYLLFEMKLLPILPLSPLKLDFIIIQDISENSIANASRAIGEMCSPLVSSRRSQPGALCANIIEFRASSSNKVFYHQFSDFLALETLRNIEGANFSWKRCSGSSLPEIAIRSFRADATKVAILNLNITLIQQGSQAIIALIHRLVKQGITLILTPIQPIWKDIFYSGGVFQELEKLSSESRLFERKDEFSGYVLDYDDAVVLPRLAEYPELRDSIRPNILHIIEFLKNENTEAQLAAITALSHLAGHAELHDQIFEVVQEIISMLKGSNCEADSAVSALTKLAERAELHHIFCQAIPPIVDMLQDKNYDTRSAAAAALSKLSEHRQLHDIIFQGALKIVKMLMRDSGSAYAVEHGKLFEVEGIFRDFSGRTALSWAAEKGHDAVVRLLLAQNGVDADSKDIHNQTPLSWAALNGHDAVVRLLLAQKGVDVNRKDGVGLTPLSSAAFNGHNAVVRLLLEQESVDADSKDKGDRTPLSWAAENGHDAVVGLLPAQEGVDINSKSIFNQTPLALAARNGRDAVVRLLLEQEGIGVNSISKGGRTPLLWAAENGHAAVIRLLLAQGTVDADLKDKGDRTPLSRAAENGHAAVVRLLLERESVNADSKDKGDRTPLSWAAENGHDVVVGLLLEQEGVDADSKDWESRTPLSWAAENGRDAVVRLLLAQEDVNVDSEDKSSRTPLSWAAAYGHDAVVRLLVEDWDVDVNYKDGLGWTPLSQADKNGHDAVVRLLLAHGAVDTRRKTWWWK